MTDKELLYKLRPLEDLYIKDPHIYVGILTKFNGYLDAIVDSIKKRLPIAVLNKKKLT